MALLLAFLPAAGHDQLWFLLMAQRWLHGATLYGPQAFDSNPPLIIWLSALPVAMAAAPRLAATFWAKLLFSIVALAYSLSVAASPAQRLPGQLRLTAAACAALGICLKPQLGLTALAVETFVFVRRTQGGASHPSGRSATMSIGHLRQYLLRPEPWIFLLIGSTYLLAIRLFAPLYFTETLPLLRLSYWAIGHLTLASLLQEAVELVLLTTLTLTFIARSAPVSMAVCSLLTAGAGASLAYLVQGTGWYYQQLPALSFFGAALTLHALDLSQRHKLLRAPTWLVPVTAFLGILAISLTAWFTGLPFTRDRAFALTSPDPAFFTALAPGTPVAILTTSVDEAMMPIERFHLQWAQRMDNLWFLPAILHSDAPRSHLHRRLASDQLATLETTQHRWMIEDLTRWHPVLVLVERCEDPTITCQELEGEHPNLLAWFGRDPAFAALWRQYRPIGARGRFHAFMLRSAASR